MINVASPLIVLIISLIAFHLVFIKFYPQPKLFWKIIDYIWILLGVVGLIGAIYSLNREYSQRAQYVQEYSIKCYFDQFQNRIKWNKNYYTEDDKGFDYKMFKDHTQAERYKLAAVYFDSLSVFTDSIKNGIVTYKNQTSMDNLYNRYYEVLNIINDDFVKSTSSEADVALNELKHAIIGYSLHERMIKTNNFDLPMLFLSPYLIALAMAIRLTKVTSEIVEQRGHKL